RIILIDSILTDMQKNNRPFIPFIRHFGPSYILEKSKREFTRRAKKISNQIRRNSKKIFSQEMSVSQDLKLMTIYRQLSLVRHTPLSFCPISLIMSDEFRLKYNLQPLLDHYQNMELQVISGYHHTLFNNPYVEALATAIDERVTADFT
ncbi:MAG: hypothetical protein RLZZ490_1860, partial [Cyanobacteriota bacterium]